MSDNNENTTTTPTTDKPPGILTRFWAWLTGADATRKYNEQIEALITGEAAPVPIIDPKPIVVTYQPTPQERAVERALSMIGKGTKYKLGASTPGEYCDCSGLTCWAYGIPRNDKEYFSDDGGWAYTNSIVADALDNNDMYEKLDKPTVGCLVVYPGITVKGERIRIGHIGIVTFVPEVWDGDFKKLRVVHCSGGNYKRTKDAIQETNGAVWAGKETHRNTTRRAYGSIFVRPMMEKRKAPKP